MRVFKMIRARRRHKFYDKSDKRNLGVNFGDCLVLLASDCIYRNVGLSRVSYHADIFPGFTGFTCYLVDEIGAHSIAHLAEPDKADCLCVGRHHSREIRSHFQNTECHDCLEFRGVFESKVK